MNLRTAIGCVCSAIVLCVGVQAVCAAPPPQVSWAAQAGGTGTDFGYGVSALPDGSSIVTGYFQDTATFGSTTLTSAARKDVFTAKMNADGTWAWATKAGGTGYDEGYAISALPDGSSIVTGYISGTAAFGSTTLTSEGNWDVFTAKMNADGTWAWATKAGGSEDDAGWGISALPDGSSIVTGWFIGDATFGSTTLTSAGSYDVFTAKMNADGTWAWATQAGDTGSDSGYDVSALPDGSSIVTGLFSGTAAFGSTTLTSEGNWDVFTAKMNADGTWAWVAQAGGSGDDEGWGISALPDGSSIVTGVFSDTATFGSTTLASAGEWDVFTAKMNADGTWAWATGAGGSTGEDVGAGVSALPDGSAFVAGKFSGPATFGSTTLAGSGGACGTAPYTYTCSDVFTARYLDAPQAPATPTAVAGDGSAAVTITPLAGGSVTSYTVTSDPGEQTCTVVAPKTSCTVEGLTNGTSYRFRATATNAMGTGAASAWSNAVTPGAAPTAAAAAVVIKGKVHCVTTTCVTTGSVPAGATRITQRATSRPSGHSATGKCTIRRTSTKRTYSCTVHVSRGTWVITTTARTQSAVLSHFSKRVRVAPRKAAVTG